ncbi:hypothetical protein C6P42_004700, partial [Pichia californica]
METISVGKGSSDSYDGYNSYQGYDSNADKAIQELAREFTKNSIVTNNNNNIDTEDDNEEEISGNAQSFNPELNDNLDPNPYKLLRTMTSMSQVPGIAPVGTSNNDGIDSRLDPL